MKYINFIWDFDGTLFDTYEFITNSMIEALKENGIIPDVEHLTKLIHLSVSDVISYYSTKYDKTPKKISESYKKFSHNIDYDAIKPFKNIPRVLKEISENDGQNFIFTHRGESTNKILDYFNLRKYFVEVVDSTYSFSRKPEPDGANYIVEKYNLRKDETLFIGDRELDILCGKNAGIKTCLFNDYKVTSECDYYIKDYNNFIEDFCADNEDKYNINFANFN